MQIKEIKEFMHWCSLGDETISKRKEMFLARKKSIEKEMAELERALNMINYKCWYYDEALKDGTEKRVKNITPDKMPKDIKRYYENAHKQCVINMVDPSKITDTIQIIKKEKLVKKLIKKQSIAFFILES